MADLKDMKGLSEKDRKTLEEAEALLGAEPETMGFAKNLFWGRFRDDLVLPYPESSAEETARCDQLLAELEEYLRNEHPSIEIDQHEEIPEWVVERLFKMGALGCTVPVEYGGLGFGITSYNRVLEMIGKYCGSTAVMVSAHQSIGCKAIMLFGTEEQKKRWLPIVAREKLSAFCLSEPNVGCDAGGQETRSEKSADGSYFTLNGEKKWSTSGALAGVFTVMSKQKMPDGKDKVTALICTPDMDGIDIFEKNRSKCGIRGTWQARIKLTNVKVPAENLLHKEGKGLNVALTCLNYGRCTLSAGMTGGAKRAMDQGIKWAHTRYQFGDPLDDKQLVREHIAHMAALTYAMDAVLYMTTGMLDRHDEDIMVETAICKVFCSEMGWRVVNDAMQIMGGESYMTENEIERIFRDSRINTIVEGSNDLMWSFIFGYGGKQLGEWMLGMRDNAKKNIFKPAFLAKAIPLGMEVFLGVRRKGPDIKNVHPSLRPYADRLSKKISEFTYQFKQMSKKYDVEMIKLQVPQSRLALAAIQLHAWACTLSKLDRDIRLHGSNGGEEFARDKAAAIHFFDLAELDIEAFFRAGYRNADESMEAAADAAMKHNQTLPTELFIIPEKTPTDMRGKGRTPRDEAIKKFPGDKHAHA
ncbi:MAG: acyl-CoA dehydrogenase family protein [Phycisphaerales bacterium]|nr:acyl-CoA dehydrogenase family protein [Phycisphaerales bacterium]MCB9836638.1 acyl-CoA dehydrogenase family protein [Phycisphaera sp.]